VTHAFDCRLAAGLLCRSGEPLREERGQHRRQVGDLPGVGDRLQLAERDTEHAILKKLICVSTSERAIIDALWEVTPPWRRRAATTSARNWP
jgi:hypothetical protein